jgi:hypothetical protein
MEAGMGSVARHLVQMQRVQSQHDIHLSGGMDGQYYLQHNARERGC